jgi:hypothetical protein
MRKTITFVAAFALALGPAVSYAAMTCGGSTPILTQALVAAQMNNILVCEPSAGPPWHAQEWTGNEVGIASATLQEFSDQARNPYGNVTFGLNAGIGVGTVSYSYTGGGTAGPYEIAVSGSTLFFCTPSNGNGAIQYTTHFKAATSVSASGGCP